MKHPSDTFMKERPILPLLLGMALPMVVSMMVNALYNIIDSFFVAQISEDAMTALSLVYPVQNFINAAAIGFGVGFNAVTSLYLGAGNSRKASIAATQGLALSVLHGLLLTAVCTAVMPRFLGMFTASSAVVELGVRYARVAFAFAAVIGVSLAFEKLFQAVGSMTVTMAGMLCGCIANILLDPVLIFGLGPFPAMGISGAALATGIGQAVTVAVFLAAYFVHPPSVRLGMQYLVWDKAMLRRLYAIGIPAILNLALPSLLVSALNAILAGYSQIYVVVLGVYYKLQTFLYLPANGIIQAMRPLIGYNSGAGEHQRVRRIYTAALCMTGGIMAAGTLLCLALPGPLMGLFTQNAQTVQAGEAALRTICAGFVASAVSVTSCGALEGLGKGGPSLVISFSRYAAVTLTAAFVLSRLLGPAGVWHAFWVAETVTAGVAYAVYRRASRPA